jgi:hypothetical protein
MIAGLIRFQRRLQCELLGDCGPLVCLLLYKWDLLFENNVGIIFSANTDVCVIFGALMSLDSGILCLSALFQAGSSGPSCHTNCVVSSVQH